MREIRKIITIIAIVTSFSLLLAALPEETETKKVEDKKELITRQINTELVKKIVFFLESGKKAKVTLLQKNGVKTLKETDSIGEKVKIIETVFVSDGLRYTLWLLENKHKKKELRIFERENSDFTSEEPTEIRISVLNNELLLIDERFHEEPLWVYAKHKDESFKIRRVNYYLEKIIEAY